MSLASAPEQSSASPATCHRGKTGAAATELQASCLVLKVSRGSEPLHQSLLPGTAGKAVRVVPNRNGLGRPYARRQVPHRLEGPLLTGDAEFGSQSGKRGNPGYRRGSEDELENIPEGCNSCASAPEHLRFSTVNSQEPQMARLGSVASPLKAPLQTVMVTTGPWSQRLRVETVSSEILGPVIPIPKTRRRRHSVYGFPGSRDTQSTCHTKRPSLRLGAHVPPQVPTVKGSALKHPLETFLFSKPIVKSHINDVIQGRLGSSVG